MRAVLVNVFVGVVCLAFCGTALGSANTIKIGTVSDDRSMWTQSVLSQLQVELDALGQNGYQFAFPNDNQLVLNGSAENASDVVFQLSEDEQLDIVIALGVISSAQVPNLEPTIPVIATAVIDANGQGFPVTTNGTSGRENIHYLSSNINLMGEISKFQQAVSAKNMAIIVDGGITSAVPQAVERLSNLSDSAGENLHIIPVSSDIHSTLRQLKSKGVDAVFMLPLLSIKADVKVQLIRLLNEARIASFSATGRFDVEQGALMGTSIIPSSSQLAKRLAIDIRDIASGESASNLAVKMTVKDRVVINMDTARAIDARLPFELIYEAEVLNEDEPSQRRYSLPSVVLAAVQQNISLAISFEDLASVRENTILARSNLLPQLTVGVSADALDRDIAGDGGNKTGSGRLSLSQTLYNDSQYAAWDVAEYLETAQERTIDSVRLDVVRQTAEAYVNLLIARNERDIQRENLRLSRSNLERAEFRFDIGATSKSDIFRFESEIGNALQNVSIAEANLTAANYQINRLINQPINTTFSVDEPGAEILGAFENEELANYLRSPSQLRLLSDYLGQMSLDNSPEIESLQLQISAQKRTLLNKERRRYIPDVALSGDVDRVFADSGASRDIPHNNNWSVGINLSLPLYQGGRISAEQRQEQAKLRALELQARDRALEIELSTRNAVARTSAARLNIDFAIRAEAAALKTFESIANSYVLGKADNIELVDAQNALLVARLAQSTATYEYILELIALQRAIAFFDFIASPAEKQAWMDSLNSFSAQTLRN